MRSAKRLYILGQTFRSKTIRVRKCSPSFGAFECFGCRSGVLRPSCDIKCSQSQVRAGEREHSCESVQPPTDRVVSLTTLGPMAVIVADSLRLMACLILYVTASVQLYCDCLLLMAACCQAGRIYTIEIPPLNVPKGGCLSALPVQ